MTPYPDQAARMILSLLEDLGYATTDLLHFCSIRENARQTPCYIWSGCCRLCRCAQRVLGAPEGSFQRSWREDPESWLVSPNRR